MRRHAKMEALRALLERRAMPRRVWHKCVLFACMPELLPDDCFLMRKGGPLGAPFYVMGAKVYREVLRLTGWEPPLILCLTYQHPKRKRSL